MKKFYLLALTALGMLLPLSGSAQSLTPTLKNHRNVDISAIQKDMSLTAGTSKRARIEAAQKAREQQSSGTSASNGVRRMPARIAAAESDPNAPVIYGFNYKSEISYQTPSSLPEGIYSFPGSSPITLNKVSGDATLPAHPLLAWYAKGYYYLVGTSIYSDADYNNHANSVLYKYDVNTWQQVGDTISLGGIYPLVWSVAQYNPVDNEVYMSLYNDEPIDWDAYFDDDDYEFPPSRVLLKMNMDTYKVDTIAKTDDWILFFNFGQDGTVYCGKNTDDGTTINTLDPTTGELTVVDSTCNLPLTTYGSSYTAADGNDVYVSMHDGEFTTSLWKGTVGAGTFTKVASFPEDENIKGIYITPAEDAEAPAAAQNISYTWDEARLNLTLNYTVPTKAYDGTDLSGAISAIETVDGNETTATVQAGEQITRNYAFEEGEHTISIVLSNEAGKSQTRSFKVYAGQDAPGAVDSLTYEVEASTGAASLTWAAPKTSVHSGPVDDSAITYRVVRQPDNTVVAEAQKETSFTETLPTKRASYSYDVTPVANGKVGTTTSTEAVAYGDHFEVPFSEDFRDESASSIWSTIDANGDGSTWQQLTSGWSWGLTLGTSWQAENDYAITPAITNLKADRDYELTFNVQGGSQASPVEYGVYLIPNLQDVSTWKLLLDKFSESDDTTKNSVIVRVPSDGSYYLGFQAYCPTYTSGDFVLSEVAMVEDALHSAPDTVSNLTVTPGAQGALNGTVSFNAPVQTADGKDLIVISKIVVYDGNLNEVKTFENVPVGASLSYDFTTSKSANQTFYVRAFNGDEKGLRAEITKFIGIDVPDSVRGLKVTMPENGYATLSWNLASRTGKNGGYVNPHKVTYRIVRWNADWYSWQTIAEGINGTSYTDDELDFSQNQQVYAQYGVYASTETGEGAGVRTSSIIGTPYAQPYKESFSHAGLDSQPWVQHSGIGTNGWSVIGAGSSSVDPFDNDGGELRYLNSGTEVSSGYIQGPRVDLTAYDASALSFYMWHGAEADEGDAYVTVYASVDDADTVNLGTFQYNDGTDGWYRHVIDLKQFAGKNNITFQFYGYTLDGSAALYLDNVRLDQFAAKDLAVQTASIPYRMNTGSSASQITASIINEGSEASGNYSVDILKNDAVVATQEGEPLAVNAVKDFTFDVTNGITEAGDSAQFAVRVNYEGDGKLQNNTSSVVSVYLNGPKYPRPTDLKAAREEGAVALTWTAPETVAPGKVEMTDPVTDDFDSYQAFIIDSIGDWTTWDADKAIPIYFGGPEVPHNFEPQAFQVWNRDQAGFQKFEVLKPHSGTQYLMAFSASDGESSTTPNDNWLISPEITGGSDIDFWTKTPQATGLETYEILYSTSTLPEDITDSTEMEAFVASFVKIADGTVDFTNWQNRGYTLPEDARYFAIRHTTQQNGSEFLIDDLTYTPLYGGSSELTLKGYNVYRDNEVIASNVASPEYSDNVADGNYTYRVSAVYDEGESMLTEPVSVSVADGVATIIVDENSKADVFTVGGAKVRRNASSLRGLGKGVYIIGNKKVVVK